VNGNANYIAISNGLSQYVLATIKIDTHPQHRNLLMFYKTGISGKALKAIFGVFALLTFAGGLVSCNVGGGGDEGGEETEQGEENEEDDD